MAMTKADRATAVTSACGCFPALDSKPASKERMVCISDVVVKAVQGPLKLMQLTGMDMSPGFVAVLVSTAHLLHEPNHAMDAVHPHVVMTCMQHAVEALVHVYPLLAGRLLPVKKACAVVQSMNPGMPETATSKYACVYRQPNSADDSSNTTNITDLCSFVTCPASTNGSAEAITGHKVKTVLPSVLEDMSVTLSAARSSDMTLQDMIHTFTIRRQGCSTDRPGAKNNTSPYCPVIDVPAMFKGREPAFKVQVTWTADHAVIMGLTVSHVLADGYTIGRIVTILTDSYYRHLGNTTPTLPSSYNGCDGSSTPKVSKELSTDEMGMFEMVTYPSVPVEHHQVLSEAGNPSPSSCVSMDGCSGTMKCGAVNTEDTPGTLCTVPEDAVIHVATTEQYPHWDQRNQEEASGMPVKQAGGGEQDDPARVLLELWCRSSPRALRGSIQKQSHNTATYDRGPLLMASSISSTSTERNNQTEAGQLPFDNSSKRDSREGVFQDVFVQNSPGGPGAFMSTHSALVKCVAMEADAFGWSAGLSEPVTILLHVTSQDLKVLKDACNGMLADFGHAFTSATSTDTKYLSSNDIISAVIWMLCCHVRCRPLPGQPLDRKYQASTALGKQLRARTMNMLVDTRRNCDKNPVLPRDYLGNAAVIMCVCGAGAQPPDRDDLSEHQASTMTADADTSSVKASNNVAVPWPVPWSPGAAALTTTTWLSETCKSAIKHGEDGTQHGAAQLGTRSAKEVLLSLVTQCGMNIRSRVNNFRRCPSSGHDYFANFQEFHSLSVLDQKSVIARFMTRSDVSITSWHGFGLPTHPCLLEATRDAPRRAKGTQAHESQTAAQQAVALQASYNSTCNHFPAPGGVQKDAKRPGPCRDRNACAVLQTINSVRVPGIGVGIPWFATILGGPGSAATGGQDKDLVVQIAVPGPAEMSLRKCSLIKALLPTSTWM